MKHISEHQQLIEKKYTEILNDRFKKNKNISGLPFVDCSYPLLLDKHGALKLKKNFNLIRNLEDNDYRKHKMLDTYWSELYRKYNDQTISYEIIPEPLQIGYKEDRVVFSGLERIAQLITGKSIKRFNWYAIGIGTIEVLPADTGLVEEVTRTSIDLNGFAESKGSTIQFASVFPATIPSIAVSESGILDSEQDPSTLFLRTVYEGNNIINHLVNQTLIAISHIVYMISV